MDISTLRLGLAHSALRQALGDEMSPISFAQGSFAFIDRQSGEQFFCCAESGALPIMAILPSGKLGDGSDASSRAIRAAAEPLYLDAWSSFARDFDRASSTEARARSQTQAKPQPGAQAGPEASATAPSPAPARSAPTRPRAAQTEQPHSDAAPAQPMAPAPRQPAPIAPVALDGQPRSISEQSVTRRAPRPLPANPQADRV